MPVAAVYDHTAQDDDIHQQNAGGQHIVDGPTLVAAHKVDEYSYQNGQHRQYDDLAAVAGLAQNGVAQHHIRVQQTHSRHSAPPQGRGREIVPAEHQGFRHDGGKEVDAAEELQPPHPDTDVGIHIFPRLRLL